MGTKTSRSRQLPKAQIAAWREARVRNYIETRSIDALARMVVELEDAHDCIPEFDIDDRWPERVCHLKAR